MSADYISVTNTSQADIRYPAPDAQAGSVKAVDSARLSVAKSIIFLIGLVTTAVGISIARGNAEYKWISASIRDMLSPYVSNYGALVTGGIIALAGAILAGSLARRVVPDMLGGLTLPLPTFQRDLLVASALGLSTFCNLVLYQHLSSNNYTHIDILLFFVGLALTGFVVHRLDRSKRTSTIRFRWPDALIALGVALLAIAVNLVDLTDWKYAFIGDEGMFHYAANEVLTNQPWNFFNLQYVYGSHPALDSIYQASVMWLIGPNIFGWRFSEVLLTAFTASLMYLLGTAMWGRLPGLAASVFIASTHYLIAFNHIAYNNTHVILYTTLAALMLVLAWRTQKAVFVFFFGVSLGFCLYTFMSALLFWPIIAILLLTVVFGKGLLGFRWSPGHSQHNALMSIYFRKQSWRQVFAVGLALLGFLLVVIPALLTNPIDRITNVAVQNTYAARTDLPEGRETTILKGAGLSFMTFWDDATWHNHYVGGPLLDLASGTLVLVGLFTALFRINKRAERLAFLWFFLGVFLVAITDINPQPLYTRLFVALPGAALLMGVAVSKLYGVLQSLEYRFTEGRRRKATGTARSTQRLLFPLSSVLVLAIIALVPVLNLKQFLIDTPPVLGYTGEAMVIKVLQEHPDYDVVEVGIDADINSQTYGLVDLYPQLKGHYQYLNYPAFTGSSDAALKRNPRIYMVRTSNKGLLGDVAQRLPASYTLTRVTDPAGAQETWLLLPPQGAIARRSIGTPPQVDSPELVVEVKIESQSGSPPAEPLDVAVDARGDFYVATGKDNYVRKYNPSGKILLTFSGTAHTAHAPGALTALAIDYNDIIYAAGPDGPSILRFGTQGSTHSALVPGVNFSPQSINITPNGDLLVADTISSTVLMFSPSGEYLSSTGKAGVGRVEFIKPADAVVSEEGEMYVLDVGGLRIQHMNADGKFVKQWRAPKSSSTGDSARMAIDKYGRLFVTSPTTNEVIIYDPEGTELARWKDQMSEGPVGIFVDTQDNVYVTFPGAGIVRKFRLRP